MTNAQWANHEAHESNGEFRRVWSTDCMCLDPEYRYINKNGQQVCYKCDPLRNNEPKKSADGYLNFIARSIGIEVK